MKLKIFLTQESLKYSVSSIENPQKNIEIDSIALKHCKAPFFSNKTLTKLEEMFAFEELYLSLESEVSCDRRHQKGFSNQNGSMNQIGSCRFFRNAHVEVK